MITAVDTNILLDILLPDPQYRDTSRYSIERGIEGGSLMICELVYSELSAFFPKKKELDKFLEDISVTLKSSTQDSLYQAGEAWKGYLKRRGSEIECPACGNRMTIKCGECGQPLRRRHIISDFIIGAHASVLADTLITRDRGIYKAYFKDLTLNFGD
ncbi:MAG TPA: type II toxin-antitoxin system VapC family toxin [Thermodesulfobacteriota bacterium]|nr:type II toxin-antitoxin system VapC family toxin [Thermodesulfobacteriota bacterium]